MCTGAFWDDTSLASHPDDPERHASSPMTAPTRTGRPAAYIRLRDHPRVRRGKAVATLGGFGVGEGVAAVTDAGIAGKCLASFSADFSTTVTGAINR